jgi:hypothetical protein
MHLRDNHLDRRAIKQLFIADPRFVHESRRTSIALELRKAKKRDPREMDMGHFWNLRSILHRHMWLSTGWRAPTSNFSSIGRALTLLTFSLGTFTVRLEHIELCPSRFGHADQVIPASPASLVDPGQLGECMFLLDSVWVCFATCLPHTNYKVTFVVDPVSCVQSYRLSLVSQGNAIFFGTDKTMIANTAIIAFGVSILACGPVLILMFTLRYLDFERQLGFFYNRDTDAYKVGMETHQPEQIHTTHLVQHNAYSCAR